MPLKCIKNLAAGKAGFIILIMLYPGIVFSQCHSGKVLSSETESGIGYVSIGIVGKNVGTVADKDGNFNLNIDNCYNSDTLRFSMIGYDQKCFLVKQFKEKELNQVFLSPKPITLKEVTVTYNNPRKVRLGEPVFTDKLRSGFNCNELGSEMGILFSIKGKVKLKDINLNVAACTYDSVTYRLNIYKTDETMGYRNILNKPIYLSFSGNSAGKTVGNNLTFDLSEYSIILEGNVLIAVELYKDLGNGKLLFNTQYFEGATFHRKTAEGNWTQAPGAIGMYLNSYEVR